MGRVKAVILALGGLVVLVLGLGMWRSPEMDWPGFIGMFGVIGDEFLRLKDDPFAILGILVIIVGAFITYQGIKRIVKG
jgi:hypothetical protein